MARVALVATVALAPALAGSMSAAASSLGPAIVVSLATAALHLLAAWTCLRRAAQAEADGAERAGWVTLALALAAPVLAGIVLAGGAPRWTLSPAVRLGWAHLAAFPLLFVAIMLLARRHVSAVTRSAWLDGGVSACTIAALSAWVASSLTIPAGMLAPVGADSLAAAAQPSTALSAATATVLVALPGLNLVLLAMVAAMVRVLGRAARATWRPLAGGLLLTAVAHAAHAAGTFSGHRWLAVVDVLLGLALLAIAATARTVQGGAGHEQRTVEGWLVLSGPVLFGAVAITVVLADQFVAVPRLAVVSALGALVLLGARVALSVQELANLAETRRQARTDELTGLGNRRYFYEELRARTARPLAATGATPTGSAAPAQPIDTANATGAGSTATSAATEFAVLRIDLNRFKAVNDALGHAVGDTVLQLAARRLQHLLAEGEVLARLGSDEFALIVHGSADEVLERATTVRNCFVDPLAFEGLTLHVGVTIGAARYPAHGETEDEVMAATDLALQRAKAATSGLAVFDPTTDDGHRDALELAGQLRTGLARGQIEAHYQPKVDLRSGALVSIEALARWRHPDRGLIPPAAFIPLATSAGLLGALTKAMLRRATLDTAALHRLGMPVAVAINVGSGSLVDDGFPEQVSAALDDAGLDPSALIVEITEDSVLVDPERSLAMLDRLRRLGVGIAIDDYGTGRASLSYLRDLPATELKLDRSFSTRILSDAKVAAMVRSTIELSHALELEVVAEGIETADIAEALAAMGCDVGQGYLYSKPVPLAELIEVWADRPAAATTGPNRSH